MGLFVREAVGIKTRHSWFVPRKGVVIRRIFVILRKRRIVPSVAGESGDGMPPRIHHCPSK
eukprot:5122908-Pleurochrysis_carterae.AAC.1